MDKRELILAVSLSLAVFALWAVYESWYVKHHPPVVVNDVPAMTQPAFEAPTPTTLPTTNSATISSTMPTTTAVLPETNPASMPAVTVAAPSIGLRVVPSTQPASVVYLGSAAKDDKDYALQLTLLPDGAAIRDVTLNKFAATTESRKKEDDARYHFESVIPDHPGTEALATHALVIDGTRVDLNDSAWTLVAATPTSATFKVDIADGDGPLLEVTKTYKISNQEQTKATSRGYEVLVEDGIRSLRPGKTVKIREVLNGPTPLPSEVDVGGRDDRTIIAGYDTPAKSIEVVQSFFSQFKGKDTSKDLTKKDDEHFAWVGQFSAYFAAIVQPDPSQQALFTVHADAQDPNAETDADRHVAVTLETPEIEVTQDKPASLKMSLYLGPKWREVLDNSYYTAFPRMYDSVMLIKSPWCGICTFSWLVTTLVAVLRVFHSVFRDWGLSIICLVLVVRTLLHPITKRSQVQMMKMGKLGPEVEKLKVKYADQPDVLNREMMLLYKEQGGAILGCLPMFLQTPIWIALWNALQGTFELRQAPFLFGYTWIKDLAKPDRLVNIHHLLGHSIPLLFGFSLAAINILPLLMAVVTYINQRYFMPMPPAATPEQEQQQKMQRGMSLIFPLMFYGMPSGLNLYYLTSMSLGIVESKIIRNHIKEQEEAEKAGRVIVPVKATRSAKRRDDAFGKEEKPAPTGFMGRLMESWMKAMAEAQKQAEDAKKQQSKKDRKK